MKFDLRIRIVCALVVVGGFLFPASAAVRFYALGDLPGGLFDSRATGVKDDGKIVIGTSYSAAAEFELFRWTPTEGMKTLPNVPTGVVLQGGVASGDFTRIASSAPGPPQEAVLWTAGLGILSLGEFPGGLVFSSAAAISRDGTMVAGTSSGVNGQEAFRWTAATGLQGLGVLSTASFRSNAAATTADGSIIVGASNTASGDSEAFIWDAVNGMRGIGDLPGGIFASFASDVSADGSVIIGAGRSAAGLQVFRWTTAGGMQGLGDLPGGAVESYPGAVSADGSTIVGSSSGAAGYQAVLWTSSLQIVAVQDRVAEQGLTLPGWQLEWAQGVSANGRHIVGYGSNPAGSREAWLVSFLPDPPTILLSGKPKIRAKENGKFKLRGTATDDAAVVRVEYQLGGRGAWKPAAGTGAWTISAKLKPSTRKTIIAVRSVDEDGQTSPVTTATIIP